MKATIDVICYKWKKLKNEEHPLMLRVTKDGKRKYVSLGISVHSNYWDFEKNKPKPNCPNKDLILNIIDKKTMEYRKQLLEFQNIEKDFSAEKLVDTVNKPLKRKSVEAVFTEFIDQLKKEKRIGNANFYKFALNSLKSFNNGSMNIPFTEIDVAWLKKYESWMKSNGNSTNTLGVRFRALRAIYNLAVQQHIVRKEYYPFDDFKVSKLRESTNKRAIPKEAIQKIMNFDTGEITKFHTPLIELSKDIFLFSSLGCGINFIDIAHLKRKNIKENRLSYSRHKTGKNISFPLQPIAIELIKKYSSPESEYLFPILNEKVHKTELQQHYRIQKIIKKVNKWLKIIAEKVGIETDLTTYVARHSYATILKRSGVNIALISETLGHSDLKTTQIYLDSFENSQIDEALENLL
jgi:site-specific recombinase XerD